MGNSKREVKEKANLKFNKAIREIDKCFEKRGYIVSNDLDDPEYQKAALSLGRSTFDSLDSKVQPSILEHIKFMDLYRKTD